MNRNIKAFGLALVAAMTLGAFAAQGASAVVEHSFNSAVESTVLTGQTESDSNAEGKSRNVFTTTAGLTVECYSTFEGTQTGKTLDQVTVHLKTTCTGGSAVHTNGCNYVFDSDTTTSTSHFSATAEHAAVSIECEPSHWIEATRPGCNITIGDESSSAPVNQSLHGVKFTNVTHSSKSALTVNATIRTIHYVATAGSFCGLAGHPAGTYTNGKFDGVFEVTGYEDGEPVTGSTTEGRTWTHGAQTDISISGTP